MPDPIKAYGYDEDNKGAWGITIGGRLYSGDQIRAALGPAEAPETLTARIAEIKGLRTDGAYRNPRAEQQRYESAVIRFFDEHADGLIRALATPPTALQEGAETPEEPTK